MSMFLIYLLVVITNLCTFLPQVVAGGCIALVVLAIVYFFAFMEDVNESTLSFLKSSMKKAAALIIISAIMIPLCPTPKQMGLIVAGAYISQSKEIQAIPPKALEYFDLYLDKELKELRAEVTAPDPIPVDNSKKT